MKGFIFFCPAVCSATTLCGQSQTQKCNVIESPELGWFASFAQPISGRAAMPRGRRGSDFFPAGRPGPLCPYYPPVFGKSLFGKSESRVARKARHKQKQPKRRAARLHGPEMAGTEDRVGPRPYLFVQYRKPIYWRDFKRPYLSQFWSVSQSFFTRVCRKVSSSGLQAFRGSCCKLCMQHATARGQRCGPLKTSSLCFPVCGMFLDQ